MKKEVCWALCKLYWKEAIICLFCLYFYLGIIVPSVKFAIIFYILLAKDFSYKWQKIVSLMGKWAMADVFAISIFIAFLGAKAIKNTTASLEPGF